MERSEYESTGGVWVSIGKAVAAAIDGTRRYRPSEVQRLAGRSHAGAHEIRRAYRSALCTDHLVSSPQVLSATKRDVCSTSRALPDWTLHHPVVDSSTPT